MDYVSYTVYGKHKPLQERRIGFTLIRPAPSLTIEELRAIIAELMMACKEMETGRQADDLS